MDYVLNALPKFERPRPPTPRTEVSARCILNRFPTCHDKEWKIVGRGASAVITAKRRSSSPLRVVGGCLAVYALLATGYQYFLEPVTIGHAAVSKAIPQSVEAIAPAAAPSAVVPPPAAVELPRSDGAPMLRDPVRGGEQTSTDATSREPASPVASEFAARAPEPTETPAVEKPKRPAKQAARSHGQPRNPLELVLRPFSALRLPF